MDSEIEGLISEGWKPRIKTRKNRRYITLRKGDKEKSLGPYSDELWNEVKPIDPWATPSQVSELEKRILEVEELQRGLNPGLLDKRISKIEKSQLKAKPSFDALILKRIKQLEESQGGTDPSLLDKRIRKLEESQRGAKPYLLKRRISKLEDSQLGSDPSLLESRIDKLEEMKAELLESVNSRLREDDVCKHIGRNGYCHYWHYTYDDVNELEYLQPGGKMKYKGNIVYLVNVKKHTLICSACQAYERRS